MLLAVLAAFAAVAVFFLGFAVAIRIARRRLIDQEIRAAAAYDELERCLITLGAGLGVGA